MFYFCIFLGKFFFVSKYINVTFLLSTKVFFSQEIVRSIAWPIKAIHYFFKKCIDNTNTFLKHLLHYSIGNKVLYYFKALGIKQAKKSKVETEIFSLFQLFTPEVQDSFARRVDALVQESVYSSSCGNIHEQALRLNFEDAAEFFCPEAVKV